MRHRAGTNRTLLRGFCAGILLGCAAGVRAVDMPAIVAHRGESDDRPENTMAAFRLAFDRGVWGVECDVHTTLDGVPVILHDETTGRTAGAGTNLTVATSTWAELKDVRVGAFGEWSGTEWESETIPRFEDYLALLALNDTSKCVVELKGGGPTLIAKVGAAIRAQPLATKDRVVFTAFDSNLIPLIRANLPDYPAWLLLKQGTYTGESLLQKIEACHATGVNLHQASVFSAEDVAAVKAAGFAFAVWVCDDSGLAHALARKGVDAITSNRAKALGDELAGLMAQEQAEILIDAMDRGGLPMDADLYVQDGLIAHFDGIRNAGWGKPHDPEARLWRNLADGAPDAVFSNTNGFWNADGNGFVFPGNVHAALATGMALGKFPTVQMATDIDCAEQLAGDQCWPSLFHAAEDDTLALFLPNTGGAVQQLFLKADTYAGGRPSLLWHGRYVTAMLGRNGFNYLVEGTSLTDGVVRTATNPVPPRAFAWGGSPWGNSAKRFVKGTIHSLRLYDRNLSETELAWNRVLDDARFHGIMSHGCVVVATSRQGLEGTEACGLWYVNGHHEFTAPATAEDGDGEWECTGFALEQYNPDAGTWTAAGSSAGTSWCVTNCAALPGLRITWQWRRKADSGADTDADGIPDWWETAHFGSPAACGAGDDPDGDGYSNREEWLQGTDPDDASSFFALSAQPAGGGGGGGRPGTGMPPDGYMPSGFRPTCRKALPCTRTPYPPLPRSTAAMPGSGLPSDSSASPPASPESRGAADGTGMGRERKRSPDPESPSVPAPRGMELRRVNMLPFRVSAGRRAWRGRA